MEDAVVIRQAPGKTLLICLGAVVATAGSIWMALDPHDSPRLSEAGARFIGLFGAAFFALCLAAAICSLVRPTEITLTRQGFIVRTWARTQAIRWTAVRDLFLWKHQGTAIIAWRLHDRSQGDWWNRPSSMDGSIGAKFPGGPQAVLDQMLAWKQRSERDAGVAGPAASRAP